MLQKKFIKLNLFVLLILTRIVTAMDFVFRARVAELHSIKARQHSSSPSLIPHSNKTALHVCVRYIILPFYEILY